MYQVSLCYVYSRQAAGSSCAPHMLKRRVDKGVVRGRWMHTARSVGEQPRVGASLNRWVHHQWRWQLACIACISYRRRRRGSLPPSCALPFLPRPARASVLIRQVQVRVSVCNASRPPIEGSGYSRHNPRRTCSDIASCTIVVPPTIDPSSSFFPVRFVPAAFAFSFAAWSRRSVSHSGRSTTSHPLHDDDLLGCYVH